MPRPPTSSKPSKGKNKAVSRQPPKELNFLKLALELRENIYRHILQESPGSLLELFVVNRQLAREVHPFLFKRPLTFDGQDELFLWLDHVDRQFLRHVRDIRFKLHDINPDQIAGALGKRLQQANITRASGSRGPDTKENPYFEACHIDLKHVAAAFRLLPNVQKLTLLGCTSRDPQPHERTLNAFAQLVGQSFPLLNTLISEDDELPIDFLSDKPRLRRLRFPGTTTTDDDDLGEIMEDLQLDELEIHRSSQYDPEDDLGCMSPFLESVSPLKALTLLDGADYGNRRLAGEVFIGAEESLRRHKRSLRSFKILDNGVNAHGEGFRNNILSNFMDFLAKCPSLAYLEIVEDYFQAFTKVPTTSLQRIVVRLDVQEGQRSLADSIQSIASHIAWREHNAARYQGLPKLASSLHQVLLYLDRDMVRRDKAAVSDALKTQRAIVRDLGIDLTWKFWDKEEKM
ncbi:hypothetical protein P7C71_g4179, partial [Lecanoromycetidae sp. Uapishka_2]